MPRQLIVFNPRPAIQLVAFTPEIRCLVVDNALLDPDRLARYADNRRGAFLESRENAYPGVEMPAPAEVSTALDKYFNEYLRGPLGGRRTLRTLSRLSVATRQPGDMEARQSICHRDHQGVDPARLVAACVLYLFPDESLGGTSFFAPRRPRTDIDRLVHDASTRTNAYFYAKYPDIAPGYLTASNDWFELVGTIPARWNRIVFYDGGHFHSAAITAPARLKPGPAQGRLTLNGFFDCTRKAT